MLKCSVVMSFRKEVRNLASSYKYLNYTLNKEDILHLRDVGYLV